MKALTLAILITTQLSAQKGGTLEGRVTNRLTGEAIPGAKVGLLIVCGRCEPETIYDAVTDESGRYRIEDITDNSWWVVVSAEGFVVRPTKGRDGTVRIGGSGTVTFDEIMEPASRLSGRVLDHLGRAAVGIVVSAEAVNREDQYPGRTTTGVDGTYVIDLPEGSYTLRAEPDEEIKVETDVRMKPLVTYFPTALEASRAQHILVHGDSGLTGYDIRLRQIPVHNIQGAVVDEKKHPAAMVPVSLFKPPIQSVPMILESGVNKKSVEVEFPREQYDTMTDDAGRFTFADVEEGDWLVVADMRAPAGERLLSGVKSVVLAKDVADAYISLAREFDWDVSIDWVAAPSFNDLNLRGSVFLIPMDQQHEDVPFLTGSCRVKIFPGSFRLRVLPPTVPGFYASSATLGTRDVFNRPFDVGSGSPPLHVVYKPGAGRVRGTVEEGQKSTIVLYSQVLDDVRAILASKSSANGTFDIPNLAPGDYYAAAFSGPIASYGIYGPPEWRLPATAIRVRVAEGSDNVVQVPLARLK